MKISGLFKLRLIFGVIILMTTLSTGPDSLVVASPGVIPAVAPEHQTSLGDPLTNQIIIRYQVTVNATDRNGKIKPDRMAILSTAAGETLTYKRAMSGSAHVLRLPNRMSLASVEAIARKLTTLPEVEYAEPDYVMRPLLAPNDPSYAAQWHYHGIFGINAPVAWDITTGSASIRVAVIDTGITDHPDLAGRWVGGYDFIADVPTANDGNGRDSDPHDPGDWVTANMCGPGEPAESSSWHGTHVAGTIGAASNNGLGVAGINWLSPIVPIRVLGRCGGFTSDIVDGMRWSAGLSVAGVPANTNPAKILNLSLGGSGACGSSYQNAINAINAAGAIVVVAAGNSSANAANHQPGNCSGVVTVAATDRDGNRTFYSNFGSVVEISAPGGETNTNSPSSAPQNGVLSTLNTGLTSPGSASYVYYQGTSMAAPHIAGVLSLMASLDPTLNFTQSLQILQSTARAFPAGSSCTISTCGSGIVDAAAALNAVLDPPATSTVGPSPTPTNTITPSSGKATRTPTPSRTPTAIQTNAPTFTVTSTTATFTEVGPSPTPAWTGTATSTATLTHTATNTALPATATDVVTVPAELVKLFSPLIIPSGGISRLSVMIFNPNPFSLTSASLVDNLPAGIIIAHPVNLSNLCGGTVAAVAGGTTLSLMGGSIPAQFGLTPGSCTVAIDVTSSTPGNSTNTIPAGALTTANGVTNTIPTSATLTVLSSPATNTVTSLPPTASATPGTSDLIFMDGFESGNLAAWSSSMIDGGDLSVTSSAALLESQELQAVIDDNNTLVVIDESPALETRYRTRFHFDPNSIPMAVGDAHLIFLGSSGTVQHLQLELRFQATGYEVRALLMNDAKTMIATSWFPLSDAPHALELDWRAATAAGANNGGLTFWIDGVQRADLTGADNDTRRIDQVRLGAASGVDNGTRGTYFFDAFESRRLTYVGP